MSDQRLHKPVSFIAAVLIIALVLVSIPSPKPAKALVSCIAAVAGALGLGLGTTAAGAAGAAVGLYVPTFDVVNKLSFDITAASTAGLKTKSCADEITTTALKLVINLVRDMVLRWIVTGRFEGPVFSASFSIDAAKTAENASRIFLSELSGINFCAGFGIPSVQNFIFSRDFTLACTLPSGIDRQYTDTLIKLTTDPASLSLEERLTLQDPQNNRIYSYVRTIDEQNKAIARAVAARNAEYAAGQGFLGIRDPQTGKITTPGSAVAKLVMEEVITSPIRQTDVANTVQQAIAAIIDTAIRVVIERGLTQAFGSTP
ncbi:MAG: hypothetical protein HY473_01440 [Candidatus Sungbacteria bacterium]|uniref:Uncharacterized protein n=1 Tax=Candidatus Sungiibacteriota bacterium TaxID=2750080 RepID=A0A933DU92_9BACT|nr:hypothetical protein [Candidatus Sungbacteria bacterium]